MLMVGPGQYGRLPHAWAATRETDNCSTACGCVTCHHPQRFLAFVSGATCQDCVGHRRWGTAVFCRWPARCDEATVWQACERYRQGGFASLFADGRQGNSAARSRFPPCNGRQSSTRLSGADHQGLHITHWSSQDLARQAVDDEDRPCDRAGDGSPHFANVDLQPHRTRYWKTARLDARFKERAEQVPWCYGNADDLPSRACWVVCVDEIPTFQVFDVTQFAERSKVDRATRVRLHPTWDREHVGVPGGAYRVGRVVSWRRTTMSTTFRIGTVSQAAQGVARCLLDQDDGPSRIAADTRRTSPGVRAGGSHALYARQCLVVQPGGNPHPCV